MLDAGQFLKRLFGASTTRDGQAHALEDLVRPEDEGGELEGAAGRAASRRELRVGPRPEAVVLDNLARKTLHAWLANRQQTLVPLTLNFRTLEPNGVGLVLHAMAAAAHVDGHCDERERERIIGSLRNVGAGETEARLLGEALKRPRPLGELLREVQENNLGPFAYAASLLAVDQRNPVDQAYLDYLAVRLALPVEVVSSLNRRYRT